MDPSVAPPGTPLDPTKVDPSTGLPLAGGATPPTPAANAKPKAEKKPKVKSSSSSRRRPSAKLLLNLKRKRKRRGSESDFSENEGGGGGASKEEDDSNKRRSGRNTLRKKYVDELDLNLSDDESLMIKSAGTDPNAAAPADTSAEGTTLLEEGAAPAVEINLAKPNFAYVDPNNEDSMVVQCILGMRMGFREIESDSEEEKEDEEKKEKAVEKMEVTEETQPPQEKKKEGEEGEGEEQQPKEEVTDENTTTTTTTTETTTATTTTTTEPTTTTTTETETTTTEIPTTTTDDNTTANTTTTDPTAATTTTETETEIAEEGNEAAIAASEEVEAEAAEAVAAEAVAAEPVAAAEEEGGGEEEMEVTEREVKEEESVEMDEGAAAEGAVEAEGTVAEGGGGEETKMEIEEGGGGEGEGEKQEEGIKKEEKEEVENKNETDSTTTKTEEPNDETTTTTATTTATTTPTTTTATKEDNKAPDKPKKTPRKIEVEEFYVKYRSFSYLHAEWRTEEELLKGDKRVVGKIKRFKQKRATTQNMLEFLEEEAFNPDYTEVDRILDVMETNDPASGKTTKHYLVKWKALAYEDSTWELEDDVDPLKIQAFLSYRDPPPKSEWKPKKRPKPTDWKQLESSPDYKNNNSLREYQLEGLNWLNFSYYNSRNCILADEMGLGKTIQSLTFVDSCYKFGIRGPFLIIAPLSTIPNWQREFEGWTDLNIIVYHGSHASRNMILEYEMYYKDDKGQRIPNLYKFNVLITTFEVIISDCLELKEIHWRCCIIDEAHRLKNRNCKLLEGLRLMYMEHRVLLSGTPLQNNVTELFSLLNFLEPTQFSCQDTFLQEFGKLETEDQVAKLQALLKPMMLRRMKEDVEKSLAPKEETIIEVELTNIQKKYYRAILERNFDFLVKGATYANVPSLMNTMMELRKCCLHPYLLNGAEDAIQQDYRDTNPVNATDPDTYYNALINSSGKMVLVDKLLPKLKDNGHRVLIFSQMVKLLDILEDYLIFRKYPYERLDGRIRGNMRQAAIDRFCKPDSDRFVFLLCTKAGGLGINLTAADTVIIYDSDWNPQNDLQAQARCHRIGQSKSVKIYRLVCRNTYEREMFDKASRKLGLDKAVLQSMNTDQGKNAAGGNAMGLSKADIEELLKKGAYGALMEEDGNGFDDFCEEDINQILSRRTTVIQHESEKGSSFSKASFSASNNRSDIEIDDPDFWKKWAKKAEIDTEIAEKMRKKTLIVEEPRRRSQIRRYGHDDAVLDCSDLDTSASDSEKERDGEIDPNGEGRKGHRGRGTRNRGARGTRGGNRGNRNSRIPRMPQEEETGNKDVVRYGQWMRCECFKVEKGLLVYGWGRWKEILAHGDFRPAWKESDVMECARMILLFCIRYYKGDDKIKGFIFDLIAPTTDGKTRIHPNHIGLSAPVPRGRKGKKKIREAKLVATHMEGADWAKEEKFDTDIYLDQGYSRHLTRHSNKVLLRVRLLFYIKQEIIGESCRLIDEGAKHTDVNIAPPPTEIPPKPWWDADADRCLLIGVYKHGYERYNVMRNDPALCFLERCGPPDKAALVAEMNSAVNEDDLDKEDKEDDKDDEDSNQTPLPSSPAVSTSTVKSDDDTKSEDNRDDKPQPPTTTPTPTTPTTATATSANVCTGHICMEKRHFPTTSDINGRLRRLVTSYQRNNRKNDMRNEAKVRGYDHFLADKLLRRERMAEYIRDRELRKTDYNQRRWSNREQAEFYRTISTFGVEYIRKEKRYDWSKFRTLSRLEKKYDETLTEYFRAFMAMCKRQCGIRLSEEESEKMIEIGVDRLPEERARRVLERVDLLNRLRNDIMPHPDLKEALKLALPSKDMPDWWIPGKHDHDLLKGVARHGLGRTDYYILYDPDLNFRDIIRRHTAGEPLITEKERSNLKEMYYGKTAEEGSDRGEEGVEEEQGGDDDIIEVKPEEEGEAGVVDKEKQVLEDEVVLEDDVKDEDDDDDDDMEAMVMPVEAVLEEYDKDDEEELEEEAAAAVKKEEDPDPPPEDDVEGEKKDNKSSAALLSLKQMDEAMAKCGSNLTYDNLVSAEPTVAQLLAQSAANPIRWPKDRLLQARIEHLMYAVEHRKWPVGIDFQCAEEGKGVQGGCGAGGGVGGDLETERRKQQKQQQMEEQERQRIQALLHPNLHHTLGLTKATTTTAQAQGSSHGLPPSFTSASLRTLIEEADRKKTTAAATTTTTTSQQQQQQQQQQKSDSLRQLQALQGSLDLTIKPVNPSPPTGDSGGGNFMNRRTPGRPRVEDARPEKRRLGEGMDSRTQEKKRRKLDEIVMGLTSKGRSPESVSSTASTSAGSNPLLMLRGSSVTLLNARDKSQVTPSLTTPKLSSSISITPTVSRRPLDTRADDTHPTNTSSSNHPTTTTSSSKQTQGSEKDAKPGLVKQSDLPPGVTLPPGIELYRPTDAKVDKWLEQHQGLMTDASSASSSSSSRHTSSSSSSSKEGKRRKLDFASLDWTQFSGEEHVSVINTGTGQRLSGQDAPRLKHLAKWLIEHPTYDVDPQWVEMANDRSGSSGSGGGGSFLADLQKRLGMGMGMDKKHTSHTSQHTPSSSSSRATLTPSSIYHTSSSSPGTSTATTSSPSASSYLHSYHKSLPFDPKSLLQTLDPKLLGFDPKLLAGFDPKMLGLDPKLLPPLDPKVFAAMGIDPKLLGLDVLGSGGGGKRESKHDKDHRAGTSSSSRSSEGKSSLHSLDPKLLGFDPKLLAGLDHKTLASLDPKFLAGLVGLDSKSMHHFDHKALSSIDPKLLASLDPKMLAGLDPKMLGGLDLKLLASLDPKMLAGIDPKMLAGLDTKMLAGLDPKMLGGLDTKMLAGLDPKFLASLDPKLLSGLDPKMLSGLDPKMLGGLDPKLLGGLDPKLLAGLDPKLLSGLDPKLLSGLDAKLLGGLDPKLLGGLDHKLLGGLDPKLLGGLDPKMLAGLDPKMLAGLDPKLLSGLDQKLLGGLDPKLLGGLDPKLLGGLDSKLLAGLDPKMFAGLDPKLLGLDPKLLGGLDPKLLDPKLLAGLDPKMLAGLDPKMLGGLDPKLLGGLDPKLLAGLDPKLLGGLDPKMFGGLDPKLLGLDPKVLASMGIDPSMMMMAGFGGLHGMGGLPGMANPLLGGLGFGLPGLGGMEFPSTSKGKDHRNVPITQTGFNFNMFPGAGGLMYPPLGLGGLGSFQLPSMSSAAASTGLLNGLPVSTMSMAGSSHQTHTTPSSASCSSSSSSGSKWREEHRRVTRSSEHREREREREEEETTAERRKHKEQQQQQQQQQQGLSREERHLLKQMKAERLAREVETRHEIYTTPTTTTATATAHLDLSMPHATGEQQQQRKQEKTDGSGNSKGEPVGRSGNASTKEVENGERSGTDDEGGETGEEKA